MNSKIKMFVFLVALGFGSSMLFSALPWEHYVNCFGNGMVPDLTSKEKKCVEVSTPQAFGATEELFTGFSSIDPPLSEIIPRKPTTVSVLFQYTSGPYAITNLTPTVEITPVSASNFVKVDVEPIEIKQGEIRRIPIVLTVAQNIAHEKIFLSISFTGEHFSSRSDAIYKSAWTESLALDIVPTDTIGISLGDCKPIDIYYEISGGKVSVVCKNQEHNSVKVFVDANDDGTITLDIPKQILYALGSTDCRLDNDFFVLYDGEEVIPNISSKESSNLVQVDFAPGIHEIEIIGTVILPDPSPAQYCGIVENYPKLYLPPLDQIQHDVKPSQIRCNDDLILVYKNDDSSACVNYDTIPKLIQRGWIDADPKEEADKNIPKFLCQLYGGRFFDGTGECMDLGSKHKCHMLGGMWDGKCIVLGQAGQGIPTEPDSSPEPGPESNIEKQLSDAKKSLKTAYNENVNLGPFYMKDVIAGYATFDNSLAIYIPLKYMEADSLKEIKSAVRKIVGQHVDIDYIVYDTPIEKQIEIVLPYLWNGYLHQNNIGFAPKDQSYWNNADGFYEHDRACSPLIAPNGTEFYISSTFDLEPFQITGTFIDDVKPKDCHKIWKTDIIMVEPDPVTMLWLENYFDD